MSMLILGIIIFFGVHSIQIVANDWRTAQVQRIGVMLWKGAYSLASLAGFSLIIWGFSIERASPVFLWIPPHWTHHAAALLMLFAFILLVATYVPGNRIKATFGHPMLLAVKVWALAHLLANGRLADVILFGAFLLWAAAGYSVLRRRDRAANVTYPNLGIQRNALVIVSGIILFVLFAHFAHQWLFGVRPL